jgi:hypothetical protein
MVVAAACGDAATMGRRGILPSLGAGTSLIVAGVIGLAIVSSIIAFRGFPGLGPDVARPPLQLPAPAADGDGRDAAAEPIIIGAGPTRVTLPAPLRVRHRTRSSERAARTASQPRRTAPPSTPLPTTPRPATPSPSTSAPASPSRSTPPAAHPRPVRDAVDQARNVVPAVRTPAVPPAVQPVADQVNQAVETVNNAVDAAAGVVDDAVGGLQRQSR